ncbi:MAG: EAL domain-containing protein [Novosphingobium sp.]|nr:EAL domain-containing protein [Novosphingobium sp.]
MATAKTQERWTQDKVGRTERDVIVMGIAIAACLLFVGIGGSAMTQILDSWLGHRDRPDQLLISAMLLNIALIIFGWRRYDELAQEVDKRRRAEMEARELAETDPLTGCLNRRSIGTIMNRIAVDACHRGQEVAALLFDLDKFKLINDLHGHKWGDRLLIEVARRVSSVVPAGAHLARLGGDEFCCFLPYDPRLQEQVDRIAVNILHAIALPVSLDGTASEITASIGIAHTHGKTDSSDELLIHEADIAMYHAKRSGRGRYCWFDPSMESESRFRGELESGIRSGMTKGEFVPFYQQQIDLDNGELVGFEMLARWHSPKLGEISPEIFIPVAEEIGLIADLSESLIKRALQDAKHWDPRLILSVNISPVQLRDPWFAQKLLRLLAEAGFPPERLEIEITESCLHEDIGTVRSMITSLKNQGIQVSLDDFGTGYSSLAQLRSLPFDRLKIDRSFVTELAEDEGNAKLVEAIVSLGNELNLPITAEGIESEKVLEVLRRIGKMKGQGFLYGKPQDAHTTQELLASRNLLTPTQDHPGQAAESPLTDQAGNRKIAG